MNTAENSVKIAENDVKRARKQCQNCKKKNDARTDKSNVKTFLIGVKIHEHDILLLLNTIFQEVLLYT